MNIHKLTMLSEDGSYGVTLPKERLREMGLFNDNGSLKNDQYLKIINKNDQHHRITIKRAVKSIYST